MTSNHATQPHTVQGLGLKWTAEAVADLFEVEASTVKRYPVDYGGVRIRNRWLFFDNLIEQAVRNAYAQQTSTQRQGPLGRPSEQEELPQGEALQYQDGSQAVGERGKGPAAGKHPRRGHQAPVGRGVVAQGNPGYVAEGTDPHGLLN